MIGRFLRLFCAIALLIAAPAPSLAQMQFSTPATVTTTAYNSAGYYVADGSYIFAAGAAAAAGTIRLTPGYIHASVTVSSLSIRIGTAAAGGLLQMAIYAADPVTNMPTGAPVYVSASQSTTSTGVVEVTGVNTALARKLYWWGVQVDTTGAAAAFVGAPATSPFFLQHVGAPSNTNILSGGASVIGMTKTGTFGTWPTLTGNATTDSLTQATTTTCPILAFKAA